MLVQVDGALRATLLETETVGPWRTTGGRPAVNRGTPDTPAIGARVSVPFRVRPFVRAWPSLKLPVGELDEGTNSEYEGFEIKPLVKGVRAAAYHGGDTRQERVDFVRTWRPDRLAAS